MIFTTTTIREVIRRNMDDITRSMSPSRADTRRVVLTILMMSMKRNIRSRGTPKRAVKPEIMRFAMDRFFKNFQGFRKRRNRNGENFGFD